MPAPLLRGDVVLTPFPFTDLKGNPVRPALIVSPGAIGQDVVVAGISSVIRTPLAATELKVDTTHPEYAATGLRVASVIRLHKLVALDQAILIRRLGRIGPLLQAEVDVRLRLVLGL